MPNHSTTISLTRPGFGRRLFALAALAAIGAAAGCASGPSGKLRDPIDSSRQDDSLRATADDMRLLGFQRDWRGYPAISQGQTIRSLDLWEDVILVQGTGSTLTVLEPRSGDRRWSVALANPLTRFLGNVRDGNVVYSSTEGEIFALDADTGNLLERLDNAQIVNTKPLRVGGLLLYGTATTTSSAQGAARAEVIAFLPTAGVESVDGVKMWGTLTEGPVLFPPILIDGAAAAASASGDILFINPSTGSLLGRSRMFSGPGSELISGEGLLFIASRDQSVYAFSPTGGRPVWRFRTEDPLTTQPAYHQGTVYIDIPSEGLTALGAATGERLWDQPSEAHGTVIGVRDGRLLVRDGETLMTVDPRSGDITQSVEIPGLAIAKTDTFEDGALYLASDLGLVAKFIPAP